MNFQNEYNGLCSRIEEFLKTAVPADVPQPLGDAMRYSLLAGGKRLRAVLLLASYSLLSDDIETALPFAAAESDGAFCARQPVNTPRIIMTASSRQISFCFISAVFLSVRVLF